MCHVNAGRLLKGPPPAGGRAARDHEAILAAANRPVESLRRVASCRQPGSRKPPFKRSQARGLEVDAFAGRKGSTIGPRKPPGHGHWVCSPSVRLSAGRVTNPEAPPSMSVSGSIRRRPLKTSATVALEERWPPRCDCSKALQQRPSIPGATGDRGSTSRLPKLRWDLNAATPPEPVQFRKSSH